MLKALLVSLVLLGLLGFKTAIAQPADLMLAVHAGDYEKVTALLASGAKPDAGGVAKPLYFAAQAGHLKIAEALLESGADPNARSKWGTPLHIAARHGYPDMARLLLEYGADPTAKGGADSTTPLHRAAENGSVEIGSLLLDYGADVNARNSYFEPPIQFAVAENRPAFAELLQKSGAVAIKVEPISSELATADLVNGRVKASECGVCHELGRNAQQTQGGPRLWDIVGRPIANQKFPYSDAMRAQTGVWTFERLNAFMADPAGSIPGSAMFQGIVRDRTDRIDLIAYLRTLAESPVQLP